MSLASEGREEYKALLQLGKDKSYITKVISMLLLKGTTQ